MIKTIYFVIFLFFTVSHAAEINESTIEANNSCFSYTKSSFISLYSSLSNLSLVDKVQALNKTCDELNDAKNFKKNNIIELIINKGSDVIGGGLFSGQAASAFSNLNNNDIQKKYKAQLEAIKEIPDRLERIRRVYMLASFYQGKYDDDTMGSKADRNGFFIGASRPENLIDSAQKDGSAGVCRHFASLLNWSLLQVSRWKHSNKMELTENDFSSTTTSGEYGSGSHAWVRVNLPVKQKNGVLDFQHFDLDTTWYPGVFVPLFPRLSGLSETKRKELASECALVYTCLVKQLDKNNNLILQRNINVDDGARDPSLKTLIQNDNLKNNQTIPGLGR